MTKSRFLSMKIVFSAHIQTSSVVYTKFAGN